MINKISINGVELDDIYVDSSLSFNKPGKVVSTFTVPGRNGALVIDEGVYENVIITFPAFIRSLMSQGLAVSFPQIWAYLIDTLAPLSGYQRIAWSWDPEHYRLGRPIIPRTPDAIRLNRDGFFDLSFDCKPQRYLLEGEDTMIATASGSITNPTVYPARPKLRIYGNGTVTIGDVQITLTNNSGDYTDVDCELMDCFRGSANRNQYVTFSGNDFPTLAAGANSYTLGTGITRLEITPRWWEL